METRKKEQQQHQLLWKAKAEPESMVTVTVGRVMSTLLTTRPRRLYDSISSLSPDRKTTSLGSLDESLWFLHKYMRDAAEREELLDEILVPMIEHSLRSKETKHGGQAMILLNWLFKDELLSQVLASNLANIILRKDDRYVTLGWCTLVRGLLEHENVTDQQLVNGIREKYDALLKILCPCIPHLSYIVCKGSTMQDGFELPSRLSVSAADCFLSLTEALIKKPTVSSDRQNTSNLKAVDQPITSIASATCEKKVKPAQESSEHSSLEREFLLWNHLQDLISLVQRLLAVFSVAESGLNRLLIAGEALGGESPPSFGVQRRFRRLRGKRGCGGGVAASNGNFLWSRKGRPLHAKGLEKVLKWLQEIKRHHGSIQDEAGSRFLKTGALLLSSCWKHYSVLLHLDDHKFSKHWKELLDQYLAGIQILIDPYLKCEELEEDLTLRPKKARMVLRGRRVPYLHHTTLKSEYRYSVDILKSLSKFVCSLLIVYNLYIHCTSILWNFKVSDTDKTMQYYTDHYSEVHMESEDGGLKTRKFFLNCICLLLGRFDGKKFESVLLEYGTQMSHILLSQLHCDDEEVIDGVVCILKAVLLKPNYSSGSCLTDTRQMDSVILFLLHLLDEQDGAARAIVMLIAEYCSINADGHCLQEILKRLSSENAIQRRNAIDVLSELIHISSHSVNAQSHLAWQEIANHLLERLGDEETVICEQTSNLLPMIDPSLVLPALVRLIYSSDEEVQSSASEACIGVLKHHSQKFEVICMLLDCLSNLNQSLDIPETVRSTREGKGTSTDACLSYFNTMTGSKLDSDRVLRLIPQWSKSVQDWNFLVGPLIDKMFAEPSNAIIVRFLSYISEHLAEAADVVLYRVLLQMRGQKENERFSKWECGTSTSEESVKMQQYLFEHLCPLLIIKLLPLRVFDDLSSSIIYGRLLNAITAHGYGNINIIDHNCVAALLLNRAFSKFELEDVRKLAAELCGRIHPQVLFPINCSQLNHAVGSQDILKIKACLFSICTSIVVRGKYSILHPAMLEIRKMLEAVLLWPSLDEDEVYKAQHGCIDCLALMICAELQSPDFSEDLTSVKSNIVKKSGDHGDAVTRNSVLTYVVHHIIHDKKEIISNSKLGCENCAIEALMPLSFRLCMVNVLISACQKISDPGKKPFARKALPLLIHFAEVLVNPEIRVGCIQFLFSAVYHLKSAVLPYSSDLLKLSLKFLRKGSEKERMAGAKLMASLMGSEDSILESISGDLVEARDVLSSITSKDPYLRQVSEKLLACLTCS
ncbi:hypothetical protein JRO89_XS11G0106900 [Xanthoceras sorbifolium]|uniref:ARM repeat superfamily protein n=1 Tax=Xanthoceras sorbifolium TaxID=99658 RepID=A0ABQ8HFC2_9ROSI|nr:hypothetical protein JRO89_XS11G0106900 [Xanthoceras sorbifolium]